MTSVWKWCVILFLATTLVAQTSESATATSKKKQKPAAITAADVQELKDALAAQQAALRAQQSVLAQQQQQIQQLTQQLQQNSKQIAAVSNAALTQPAPQLQMATLKSDVAVQQDSNPSQSLNLQETKEQPDTNPMHGPVSIHFRGITITPGGFAEAAFVRRSRALGAVLATPFNSL